VLPKEWVAQGFQAEVGQRVKVIEAMPVAIAGKLVRVRIPHAAVAAFDAAPDI
jgi:hypothetical protein